MRRKEEKKWRRTRKDEKKDKKKKEKRKIEKRREKREKEKKNEKEMGNLKKMLNCHFGFYLIFLSLFYFILSI